MTKTVKRTICFSAMGLILAIILAVNIVAGVLSELITDYLYGFGVSFSGTEYEEAMAQGDDLCKEIAAEGIVLLRNENNALPLKTESNLNVFGWSATDGGFVISGSGSGSADERGKDDKDTKKLLLKGLTEEGFSYNTDLIAMYEGYQPERKGRSLDGQPSRFFRLYEPAIGAYSTAIMDKAKAFSDTALIVISRLGGENEDIPRVQYKGRGDTLISTDTSKTYLQLSTEEREMIALVRDNFSKVVMIINTCNVMELGFLDEYNIDAALSVSGLGQSGAVSLAKILKGKINPSGKTVDTYVYDMKNDPTYVNAGGAGVTQYSSGGQYKDYIDYAESIYVGYRYYETAAHEGYIDYNDVVQYPFGYGLSYTKFEWEIIETNPASGSQLTKNGEIEVTVAVTNIGSAVGKDVVQLYYTAPYKPGGIEKPYVALGAFAKTGDIPPGLTQKLTLSLNVSDMASYDCYDSNGNGFYGYELDSGNYEIKLQTDAHTLDDCDGAKITFSSANIKYGEDPVSGYPVKNLFTGDEADGGVSIDGYDSSANITYLSRSNFEGTFAHTKKAARSKNQSIANLGDRWGYNQVLTDEMPAQGVPGDLRLSYKVDRDLVMNDELALKLGGDYDSPLWESLLNQITTQELINLVRLGGYRTYAVSSIGKVECIDLDGPSGLNQENMTSAGSNWTCYPVETVMASAWNAQLSYNYGLAIGKEASSTNVSGWYAPAVNLHRSPFEGRNFEYYSEDPYLSGVMGAETTRGATANGLYCYVKHYAINETETGRSGLFTWLTEQSLRELYLKPFEIAVKEGSANAIMSSFNRIGAIWTGGSYPLLTTILRNEWGFRGSVVTDYSNGGEYHMNADQGLRAGNDFWLSGGGNFNSPAHTDTGSATGVYVMRQAAKNILYTYVNTYYTAKNHDSSEDRFVAEIGLKQVDKKFPYWIFGIVALDIVTVAGIAVWCYFLLRKKKVIPQTAA